MPKLLCCPWPRSYGRNEMLDSAVMVPATVNELEVTSTTEAPTASEVSFGRRQPKEVAVRALVSARELVSSPYVHRVDAVITKYADADTRTEKPQPAHVPAIRFMSVGPSKEFTLPSKEYAEAELTSSPVHLSPRSIIEHAPRDEAVQPLPPQRPCPGTPSLTPAAAATKVYGTEDALGECERCLGAAHPLLREACMAWLRTFVSGVTSRLVEACFVDGSLTLEMTGAHDE